MKVRWLTFTAVGAIGFVGFPCLVRAYLRERPRQIAIPLQRIHR